MALVKTKEGEDAMKGYDYSRHSSPDRNYVPGYGIKSPPSAPSTIPDSNAKSSSKRDSLSTMWHIYAKNHSANPYTEYHKAHNANIFNHVKEHYGIEVAKAMHGHAEALRQGGIYAIRKKYNIMEDLKNKDKVLSSKKLARRLITNFREKQLRNRKRLKKVSRVYADQLKEDTSNSRQLLERVFKCVVR